MRCATRSSAAWRTRVFPPDIRGKAAGHGDPRVHDGYTQHETETLRGAVALLPSFKAQ